MARVEERCTRACVYVSTFFEIHKAEMLASLAHRNIIGFYGACTTAPNFFIVTEFAQNGSLFHFLEKYTLEHSRLAVRRDRLLLVSHKITSLIGNV